VAVSCDSKIIISWMFCVCVAYIEKRTEPLNEMNAVENGLNTDIAVNYDSIPARLKPSAPCIRRNLHNKNYTQHGHN